MDCAEWHDVPRQQVKNKAFLKAQAWCFKHNYSRLSHTGILGWCICNQRQSLGILVRGCFAKLTRSSLKKNTNKQQEKIGHTHSGLSHLSRQQKGSKLNSSKDSHYFHHYYFFSKKTLTNQSTIKATKTKQQTKIPNPRNQSTKKKKSSTEF